MTNLPFHNLPEDLKPKFYAYLKQYEIPNFIFLIKSKGSQFIFINAEKAKMFSKSYGDLNILKTSIQRINFDSNLIFEPCLSCEFSGYHIGNSQMLKYFFSVARFLEDYLLSCCKKMFNDKNINELHEISKDILEHYNPSSSLAHFYIGFCFYCFGDTRNFNTSVKNLEIYDRALAQKLLELQT